MRISELLIEQDLTERPMGLLKGAALGAVSKLGIGAAGDRQEIGNRANFLKRKYTEYLNANDQQATAESLIAFLNSIGYPTDAAGKIVGVETSDEQQPAADQDTDTDQPDDQSNDQQKQPAASKADSDPYEQFKSRIRQVQQPKPGANQLPDNIAKTIEPLIANLAKGDKESGSLAARKILGIADRGYDVSKIASQWAASSKAGERFLTQSVFISISKMLKEQGLYWSDLGIKLRLNESQGRVYVQLYEQDNLDDKVVDQALTAAVQDAVNTGLVKLGAKKSTKQSRGDDSEVTRVTPLDAAKEKAKVLKPSDKQELINFLDKQN